MPKKMRITILGSGTSTGVPIIGCQCAVCQSTEPKNQRSRASLMITDQGGRNIIIDTCPEFRLQMLREKVAKIEAVLYTHLHADHCHGFDDLRAFYFLSGTPVQCFLAKDFVTELQTRFSYAFKQTGYLGTKPQVDLNVIEDLKPFSVGELEAESFRVQHGDVKTSVFRFGNFAYATDFKSFSEDQIKLWRGKVDVMVASGIHFGDHKSHSVIPETIDLFQALGVKRGIITHLAHDVEHVSGSARLPKHVSLAYDGMRIDVN